MATEGPHPLLLRWIKESWDSVSEELIRKSFLRTGISLALDGTEDDLFGQESDGEDPFEGFTPGEVEAATQLQENRQGDAIELDGNEYSEPEDAADDAAMDDEDDMYDDPSSPGH